MFKHILVPIDGSEISIQAGRKAIALAKHFKAKMTAVTASASFRQLMDEGYLVPIADFSRREWEASVAGRAQAILGRFVTEAKDAGVACAAVHVFNDEPHQAIVDTAKKNDCDLIVIGSHGHGGFKQLMLGSETVRVLSHSKIPVLVYR
jgi:nucleotide-binding universal stress UspA family protein